MKYLGIIAVIIIIVSSVFFFGCNKKNDESVAEPEVSAQETEVKEEVKEEAKEEPKEEVKAEAVEGLKIEDVTEGDGPAVKDGDMVKVHYTGMLTNGKVFDSSKERGEPFSFMVGGGSVIEGWEKGLLGMKVGGKRMLTISPELGYGDRDMGDIPPNSTLIFEIDLLGIE